MREFDCLSEHQPLEGHFFLEASAGTGKTFAIENIVTRLLAGAKNINEILLVTFTRAATRDMRARILANIEKQDPPLVHALAHFDEAQIYTIHGFCHAMLQEYALEAGAAISTDSPDDQAYLSVVDESIVDFFRTGVSLPTYHPCQLEHLLRGSKGIFNDLVKRVRILALSSSNFEEGKTWHEIASSFPESVPESIAEEFMAIAPLFKGLCNVQKYPHERFIQQIDKLLCGDPTLLLEKDPFFAYFCAENLKKNTVFPQGELIAVAEKLLTLWEEASSLDKLFARVVLDCRPKIKEKLEACEMTPPDMLLQKMAEALQKPNFLSTLQSRFSVAIIDEFQDTDPLQWEIFRTLFLNKDKTLYLVGDPKQSIYGFRGADVHTYLQAKKEVGENKCYSLSTNYRSQPSLIHGLNRLFSGAPNWLGEIGYQPVSVNPNAKEASFSDAKGAVHFAICQSKGGRSVPSQEEESFMLFPYIAQEIASLQIPLSQIAVLIKDRYQALRLQRYFQELGIPSQAKGAVHIAQTKMYWVMEKVLMAFFDPSNTGCIKQILGSPIGGYSHWELRELLEVEMGIFQELAQIMEKEGFAAAFSELMDTSLRGKKVQNHLTASDVTDYADFVQLGELLIERSIKRLNKVEDLLDYLQEIAKEEVEERPELKRRVVLEGEAVQIMTTHMSKGLEYEIVFAVGMASRSPHDDSPLEKMRQFYVAMTRAKKRVYLPIIFTPKKGNAPVEYFLKSLMGTESYTLEEIEDKLASLDLSCERMQKSTVKPVQYKETVKLHAPVKPPTFTPASTLSFSQLAQKGVRASKEVAEHTGLPLGAETGSFLHGLIEKIIDRGLYLWEDKMHEYLKKQITSSPFALFDKEIVEMIDATFSLDLGGFTLQDVPPQNMVTESAFRFFSKENVVIKGVADLVFFFDGKYFLIDWKSNYLSNYHKEFLEKEMRANDYFLQASIYAKALKKYLRNIEAKSYEEVFGGAYYIFLRGINYEDSGVYSFAPDLTREEV